MTGRGRGIGTGRRCAAFRGTTIKLAASFIAVMATRYPRSAFDCLTLDRLTHQSKRPHFSEFRMAVLVARSPVPRNAVTRILLADFASIRRDAAPSAVAWGAGTDTHLDRAGRVTTVAQAERDHGVTSSQAST